MSSFAKYLMAAAGNSSEGVLFKNISDYSHVRFNAMDVSGYNSNAVFISPDGTKFYTLDGARRLKEYSLSTAYDISTNTVNYTIVTGASNGNDAPRGMYFKPDGTKLWISDNDDFIYEWSMSTAWDLSTASYQGRHNFATPFDSPAQLLFKPDGTQFMAVDVALDYVRSFAVSSAWSLSSVNTSSYTQSALLDVSPINEGGFRGIFWNDDGTKVYLTGAVQDKIMMWNTDPYDVTDITGSPDDELDVSAYDTAPAGLCFSTDGKHMYVAGLIDQGVDQFVRT